MALSRPVRLHDLRHRHAESIIHDHNFTPRNEAIVDVYVDRFADLAVQLQHRSPVQFQQLRHAAPGPVAVGDERAVEIVVDGQVVAGDTSVPGKWWEKTDSFISNESVILARKETPFDILWGDYDLPTKAK